MAYEWFNIRKAAQVVAFFAARSGARINIVKLTKLIYLSDRRNMEKYDFPITADDLGSMKFGPVNSLTRRYLINEFDDPSEYWGSLIAPKDGHDIRLTCDSLDDDNLDELSDAELGVLSEIWDEFGQMADFALAQWTHDNLPEWTDPNGSYIPISYSTLFRILGKSDPIGLAQNIANERELMAQFNKH